MEKQEDGLQKKPWKSPNLVVFGDITSLTQTIKPKQLGDRDDFATNPGVSTAP